MLSPAGAPSIAPDGSALAYTVIDNGRTTQARSPRSGVPWYALGGDIWVTSLKRAGSSNLTRGQGHNWAPSWAPDGRRIAFLSNRSSRGSESETHLWLWEVASGHLRQVSDLPVMDAWGRLGRLEWSDNRTVLVKALPRGASSPLNDSTAVTVRVFRYEPLEKDAVPSTDPTNLDELLGDLALIDVQTGAVKRVSGTARISSYALSPDRRRLAWAVATRFARPGSHQILVDIIVHDLRAEQSRKLVEGAPLVRSYPNYPLFTWSPTGQAIAYRTNGIR